MPPAVSSHRSGPPPAVVLPPSVPTWIRIPAIRASAPVKAMGLLRDGYIQVPPLVPHSNLVGWYKYGPSPGELGPAIMVGHRDSDGVAVFYLLGDLKRRDKIYISRADGTTAIFTVTKVRNFDKSTFPSVLVYGPTTYPALRVITCGGTFNYAIGSYEENIVVYATMTAVRIPRPARPRRPAHPVKHARPAMPAHPVKRARPAAPARPARSGKRRHRQ
jgi:Sortase domain